MVTRFNSNIILMEQFEVKKYCKCSIKVARNKDISFEVAHLLNFVSLIRAVPYNSNNCISQDLLRFNVGYILRLLKD